MASGLVLILQAGLLSHIIYAAFLEHATRASLLPWFAVLLAVIGVRSVLAWAREVAGFKASKQVRCALRLELIAHIAALGPLFTRSQQTGALASSAVEQIEALDGYFARYLPQLALALALPLAILVVVYPLNWAVGTIFVVTAPLIPLFMTLIGLRAAAESQRHFQALARMSAHFLDILQGLATLKLFDRARAEVAAISQVTDDYRKGTMRVLRIAFLSSTVLEFFTAVAIALTAVYLGLSLLGRLDFGYYNEPLSLRTALFMLILAPEFYAPLRQLGAHHHDRAQALGAAEEILSVLSRPVPAQTQGKHRLAASDRLEIRFQNVCLAYAAGRQALAGVSFIVHAGEKVTVIGPSGAGKTSLFALLLGQVRPDSGRISINGIDLAELDPEDWRRQIAWVGQNPVLFHGTIRENILLGRPDASPEQVRKAAQRARVWEFAQALPNGLDTPVGERGLTLSGGQAQRVALARAFVRDAPLLLLDEPTASLDETSEHDVLAALDELAAGRTVLMLSHRLAWLERSDRILLLEAGRLVEQAGQPQLTALAHTGLRRAP